MTTEVDDFKFIKTLLKYFFSICLCSQVSLAEQEQEKSIRMDLATQKLIKLLPAKKRNQEPLKIHTQVYHIPSSSTFFWDKNLINLKRRNPMGQGILSEKEVETFKKVIELQSGKKIANTSLQTFLGGKALLGIAHFNAQSSFLKIISSSLDKNNLQMKLVFGIGDKVPEKNDLNKKANYDCEWAGKIPLGTTLYLVSRSKSLKDENNYLILMKPTITEKN